MDKIGKYDVIQVPLAALTSTGVKATLTADSVCEVVRWGVVLTTAASGTVVLTAKYRPTSGSGTGESSRGTITLGTTDAVGRAYYQTEAPPVKIKPGEDFVVDCTTAAGAGAGHIFIQYTRRSFQAQTADFTKAISRAS